MSCFRKALTENHRLSTLDTPRPPRTCYNAGLIQHSNYHSTFIPALDLRLLTLNPQP
jgi:hypothetical protein